MSTSRCCGSGETLVFACAGAAYSGQLANRAGVQLMKTGKAQLFCIAAMAAGLPDKLARARQAARRMAIDGCDDHCCRKIMEQAGLPVDAHVVVTDCGIEKQPQEPHFLVHGRRVVNEAEAKLAGLKDCARGPTTCCG